jgi:hypothetical protein
MKVCKGWKLTEQSWLKIIEVQKQIFLRIEIKILKKYGDRNFFKKTPTFASTIKQEKLKNEWEGTMDEAQMSHCWV